MNRSIHCNVEQLSGPWFRLRGRLTSSKMGFIEYAHTVEEMEEAAEIILGLKKVKFTKEQTANMNVGTKYEDNVREHYSKKIGKKIKKVGFYISMKYPFLGGSPDGMLPNGDIIEIKITTKDEPGAYAEDYSEIYPPYYYQMLTNCYLTGAKCCHFIVFSRKTGRIYYRKVYFDKEVFKRRVLFKCLEMYNEYMRPLMAKHDIPCYYSTLPDIIKEYHIEEEQG